MELEKLWQDINGDYEQAESMKSRKKQVQNKKTPDRQTNKQTNKQVVESQDTICPTNKDEVTAL